MKHAKWFLLILVFLFALAAAPLFAAAESPVFTFDLEYAQNADRADPDAVRRAWDETFLIAALQGLVNRDAPRLYLSMSAKENRTSTGTGSICSALPALTALPAGSKKGRFGKSGLSRSS